MANDPKRSAAGREKIIASAQEADNFQTSTSRGPIAIRTTDGITGTMIEWVYR